MQQFNVLVLEQLYITTNRLKKAKEEVMATQKLIISCLLATSVTLVIGFFIRYIWIKTFEKNPNFTVKIPFVPLQIAICFVVILLWGLWANHEISSYEPLIGWALGLHFIGVILGLSIINTFVKYH